ncbi:MAG TPA: glycosyltransferase [Flavobacterium sp.]|jgi:glycosyltransferase involved in cell wall biosynthesis
MQLKTGINWVGLHSAKSGFGEAFRGNLRACESAGIPIQLYDARKPEQDRTAKYSINVVQLQLSLIPGFLDNYGHQFLENRYNIGYWVWETEEISDEFLEFAFLFDEIWTASAYCQKAFAARLKIPIVCIPHVAATDFVADQEKPPVDIAADKFVFLNIFDFGSLIERKNTLGLISAFELAFGSSNPAVLLLIKSSSADSYPDDKKLIADRIASSSNIRLIDEMFAREDLLRLINRCQCYVSLHRSEGFGLNLADAMAMGKPVIATGYSGNLEFMNVNNSLLVKYKLTLLETALHPFPKNTSWATADVEHAAALMKVTRSGSPEIAEMNKRAQADIRTGYSSEAIGRIIKSRVKIIEGLAKRSNTSDDLRTVLAENVIMKKRIAKFEKSLFFKMKKSVNQILSRIKR